jgi:hypothetical protein
MKCFELPDRQELEEFLEFETSTKVAIRRCQIETSAK